MKSLYQISGIQGLYYSVASFGMTFFRVCIALYAGAVTLYSPYNSKEVIVISTLFIMILDYYDGVLFDKSFLRDVKEWRINRRILDSIVDRAVIQIICIPLLINHKSFLWIYVAILLREIVISGYLAALFKSNVLLYPRLIAKLACAMVGVTTIAYLTTTGYVYLPVTGFMLVMSCLAFMEYRFTLKKYRKESVVGLSNNCKIEIV